MISEHQIRDSDKTYMQMALNLAQEAYCAEEVPVGAVLVKDEEILATGFNQREGLQDPTAHAELLAIRAAAETIGAWRLTDTTLYVTLEPCAMCAGAIIQSRISRLVFGTWDPKAGACGSICDLTAETRFNHRVIVHSGTMADDCRHLLQQFFQQLREAQPVPS
jgi:tRNA(adenine34) deaminase